MISLLAVVDLAFWRFWRYFSAYNLQAVSSVRQVLLSGLCAGAEADCAI